MTEVQIKILSGFICSKPICEEDTPNLFVYGQPYVIGNSYSKMQKQTFVNQWKEFADKHPDIWALMPLRKVKEKNEKTV
jgi:hypothetical protein